MAIVSMWYCHPVQMSFQGFDRESQKRLWGITQKACSLSLRLYSAIITHTCTHTSSTNTACHRIWWNLRICVLPVRCAYREKKSVPEQVQSSWTSKVDVCATLMFAIFLAHQSGCAFAEAQTRSQRSRNSVRDSKSERFLPASFMSTLKFSYLRSSKKSYRKLAKFKTQILNSTSIRSLWICISNDYRNSQICLMVVSKMIWSRYTGLYYLYSYSKQ